MREQFKIKLDKEDIELWNLFDYLGLNCHRLEFDEVIPTAIIDYTADIWLRDYGISNVSFNIDNIDINVVLVLDKETISDRIMGKLVRMKNFDEAHDTVRVEFDIKVDQTWRVDNELKIEKNNGVPQDLDIELTRRKITVS